MITGIVVALPEELASITTVKIAKGSCKGINDKTIVAFSGAGSKNAIRAAELLVLNGASQLISWGCAAALSQDLKPGDLVLADALVTSDGRHINTSRVWLDAAKNHLPDNLSIYTGTLAESEHLVSSSQEKQRIHKETTAIALDMESAAIARVAEQYGLPFLILRAIADPATMNLPRAVSYALNADGDVALSKLLLFLAGHPGELPGLIKLGLHFQAAKKTLLTVARQLDGIANSNVTTSYA